MNSEATKRVRIAQDVILQLKQKRIVANEGRYFLLPFEDPEKLVRPGRELQKVLPKIQCRTCALGGLFAARVNLFNKFKITKAMTLDCEVDQVDLQAELRKYFDGYQLDLIEIAFETTEFVWNDVSPTGAKRAISFGKRYLTSRNRMIGIMRNIIKNDGTFIP